MELKYCKDCARAKHKEGFSRDLWYCGKHRQATIVQLSHNKNGDDDCDVIIQKDIETVKALPPVNTQAKTGHWVYKIYGGFHEQGDWYCSKCDYPFNYGYGHVGYCPKCGCEMSETPTEEVIRDRDYDWVIKR